MPRLHGKASGLIALALLLGACTGSLPPPARTAAFAAADIVPAARQGEHGLASWYGERYHGRTTASGARFDMNALTAAHRTLPFGTRVRVTNLDNARSIVLTINDRGPFITGRIIDVSRHGAERLGFISRGVVPVTVEIVGPA